MDFRTDSVLSKQSLRRSAPDALAAEKSEKL